MLTYIYECLNLRMYTTYKTTTTTGKKMQEVKLTITKSWNSLKDFYNSDEMIKLWNGFRGRKSQLRSLQKWHNQGDIVFKRGVMINGDLYQLYTAEGIKRIQKIEISICLSNEKVSMCSVKNDEITFLIDPTWGNKSKDRELMRKTPEHIFFGNL
jgi:hypothetical protein